MLYAIHGTDDKKTRKKAQDMAAVLQSKRPDALLMRMSPESWSSSDLDEMLSGINLFVPKNIIVLDHLLSNKESEEYISKRIADLADSEHICILLEGKLAKATISKIEKKAEKIEEHNLAESSAVAKKQAPQTFAFADALSSKSKAQSWKIFQSLAAESIAAEEIHGVLWWQFKSMLLADACSSAKEAGLNPYVHQKCKGFLRQRSRADVESILDRLVGIYHRAHRGEIDFMSELELMCLE